jgi:hypothetical protein
MFRGLLFQTPRQLLQSVARGLGNLAAFFPGNPAARMVQIIYREQRQRPATTGTSPVELLWQLEALRTTGILTTEEFAEKKVQLLARI